MTYILMNSLTNIGSKRDCGLAMSSWILYSGYATTQPHTSLLEGVIPQMGGGGQTDRQTLSVVMGVAESRLQSCLTVSSSRPQLDAVDGLLEDLLSLNPPQRLE